jgi:hypothetical protein
MRYSPGASDARWTAASGNRIHSLQVCAPTWHLESPRLERAYWRNALPGLRQHLHAPPRRGTRRLHRRACRDRRGANGNEVEAEDEADEEREDVEEAEAVETPIPAAPLSGANGHAEYEPSTPEPAICVFCRTPSVEPPRNPTPITGVHGDINIVCPQCRTKARRRELVQFVRPERRIGLASPDPRLAIRTICVSSRS